MGKWMDGYLERLELNHRENAIGDAHHLLAMCGHEQSATALAGQTVEQLDDLLARLDVQIAGDGPQDRVQADGGCG